MPRKIARWARMVLCLTIAMPFASLPLGPPTGPHTITFAHADDDDDDDDRGASSSVGRSTSRGGQSRSNSQLRPLQFPDLRFLLPQFGRERQAAPRRASRQRPVPTQVANELIALGIDETSIGRLVADGYAVADRQRLALTDGELVRLRLPPGIGLDAARERVRQEAAGADVDFNHYYQPEQEIDRPCGEKGCALKRHLVGWPSAAPGPACTPSVRIGLVDTSINRDHTSLSGARLEVLRLDTQNVRPSGAQHGTAVAALLVGATGSRAPGLLPSSQLVAVDVFRQVAPGADRVSAYDLVRALDALAGKETRVVNLSLAGPHNDLLETAIEIMTGEKRTVVVAAVGNAGPQAKPQYPAAYGDVIAVTAVDARRNIYRRAIHGDHVDIAAPGVDVWTAASIAGARTKSGTSFAAPFVTAAAALLLARQPDLSPSEVTATLTRDAQDMGKPGKDAIFGWGLLNVRGLCPEADGPLID